MGAGASANSMSEEDKRRYVEALMQDMTNVDDSQRVAALTELVQISMVDENKGPLAQDSLGLVPFYASQQTQMSICLNENEKIKGCPDFRRNVNKKAFY